MRIINSRGGFTLLETVIYIALLAIMIGGGMVGIFNILGGSGRTRQAMYREQEAYFITRKIDAVLSEAESLILPSPDVLTVDTGSEIITVNISDEQIFLKRGGTDAVPLNDTLVPATSLNFDKNDASSTVITTFTLDEHLYSISNFVPTL